MAKTAPVQDHKSALPSRRGRDTHPGPTVEVVRAYARVVTLAWWEGCLSGRGAPAMPVQAPPDAWPPAPLGAASTAEAKALGAFLAGLPAREAAARLGQFYSSLLPEAHRAENGIHYTPPALARLLLDRAAGAGHDWTRGMAVDPSCGAGALLVEAALRMATALDGSDAAWIVASVSQRLLGWDIDPFAAWLARVSVEIALLPHVLASGTRLGPVSACRDSLAGWDGHEGKHALVMGNPPFGRVKDTDELRGRFGRSLRGRPNLYTLFTDLAVHLAAPEGGIVAYLMPAGYLGGQYSTRLRELLAVQAPPASIDIVHSRAGVFEGVHQEVTLGVFRRGRRPGMVRCAATWVGRGSARSQPTGDLVLPEKSGQPWLLPRTPGDASVVRSMCSMPSRLSDWGYEVATGPLVWNRNREALLDDPLDGCVPVVWAATVGAGGVFRPGGSSRPAANYYRPVGAADPNLVRSPCLLVRRTTSKEQPRRLVSAILPRAMFDLHGGVCVENHLNMVRATGDSPAVSLGTLAAFFSSGMADRVIRCINGSVAVSASELAAMPLPSACDTVAAMASADPEGSLRRLYGADRTDMPMPTYGDGRPSTEAGSPPGTPWPQLRFPADVPGVERDRVLSLMEHLFGTSGREADRCRPDVFEELIRLGGRPVMLPNPMPNCGSGDAVMHPARSGAPTPTLP